MLSTMYQSIEFSPLTSLLSAFDNERATVAPCPVGSKLLELDAMHEQGAKVFDTIADLLTNYTMGSKQRRQLRRQRRELATTMLAVSAIRRRASAGLPREAEPLPQAG